MILSKSKVAQKVADTLFAAQKPLSIIEIQNKVGSRPSRYTLDRLVEDGYIAAIFSDKYGNLAYLGLKPFCNKKMQGKSDDFWNKKKAHLNEMRQAYSNYFYIIEGLRKPQKMIDGDL